MHHTPRVETYAFGIPMEGHGGGDKVLAKSFISVMSGAADSVAPLETGLLSVLMCLKAKESAKSHTFKKINPTELGF